MSPPRKRPISAPARRAARVAVSDADLSTLYRLGDGGLSPLTGADGPATFDRVLDEEVIVHEGKKYAWTIPLAFPVDEDQAATLKPGQTVALVNGRKTKSSARWTWRRVSVGQAALRQSSVYGTERWDHPGGRMTKNDPPPTCSAATVRVLPQPKHPEYGQFILSPRQTRALFRDKGWKRVVAFQTAIPLHRARVRPGRRPGTAHRRATTPAPCSIRWWAKPRATTWTPSRA